MYYSAEKNTQILISLLKAHNIKKIVTSPGATNLRFVGSIQNDPYFEIYSSVDERSAAYIACGMAAESGEPVALSCTGATASRNYISGLTEAFYRKLPICAITSTQFQGYIGQNVPQVIDRSNIQNDVAKISVHIPNIKNREDEWYVNLKINEALLELRHNGGGPVHINLETNYSNDYSVKELPYTKAIKRICNGDTFPVVPKGKIGIFVGNHKLWDSDLTSAIESFCKKNNAVVLCDNTSNYFGSYKVNPCLVASQDYYSPNCINLDLLIHIGDVSGAYINLNSTEVWRVNPDGKLCDTFKKLKYVFEMSELDFFKNLSSTDSDNLNNTLLEEWIDEDKKLRKKIPELPFSNLWIAQQLHTVIPSNAVIHFSILNSLRSWNFFNLPEKVGGYSNTGGFGIDGCVSSLLGASLVNDNKLYYGIIGDLAFFYDLNSIGNRHVGKNLRILVINNGCGTEFHNYNHLAAQFGDETDCYIAADGHYGNKSKCLIKNYAENLGFNYISAANKDEFSENIKTFSSEKIGDKSIIFEVFTDSSLESDALKLIRNLEKSNSNMYGNQMKKLIRSSGKKVISKIVDKLS